MIYNRITVAFGALRKVTAPSISYQYDVTQILVIRGLNLPEYYVVDFCNEGDMNVVPITGTAEGVEIPDSLLQTGKPIKAYIVVSSGQGDVQTRYEVKIPVNNRPLRNDVTPTEDEQLEIDTLIAALNNGVTRAETAVSHYPKIVDSYWYVWDGEAGEFVNTGIKAEAVDGVSPTVTVTDIAGGHRITIVDATGVHVFEVPDGIDGTDGVSPSITVESIEGGHRVTVTDATQTQVFNVMDGKNGTDGDDGYSPVVTITNIEGGHRVTITDKDHPQGQTFDVMDGTTPENPVTSVNQKTGDVVLDSGDIGYDSTEAYSDGSVGKELTTINSALTSLSSVTEIIDTASGAIASFPDGAGLPMRSLVAQINPVQDLHGYENPWPAGGGVNKANLAGATAQSSTAGLTTTIDIENEIITISGTFTGSGTSASFRSFNAPNIPTNLSYKAYEITSGDHLLYTGVRLSEANVFAVDLKNLVPNTATNIQFHMVAYEGSTEPTAWSPYSNICPISGWTGVSGQRTGKNLLEMHSKVGSNILSKNVSVKAGTYTASADGINGNYAVYVREATTEGSISGAIIASRSNQGNLTFTLANDTAIMIQWYVPNDSSPDLSGKTFQLELGSTASPYEEYTGEAISVSWQDTAGTVYGGTATYNGDGTWTLVAEGILIELDGTEQGWIKYSTQTCYNQNIAKLTQYNSGELYGYCSHVGRNSAGVIDIKILGHAYSGNGVEFKKLIDYWGLQDNEPETWKAYLAAQKSAGTPIQIVAYLQTPQTYTITTGELIDTLYGQNNVWVDTGDVSVTYQASIKGYIDKVLAS